MSRTLSIHLERETIKNSLFSPFYVSFCNRKLPISRLLLAVHEIHFRLEWRRSKGRRDNNCPERLFSTTDGQLWVRKKAYAKIPVKKILTTEPVSQPAALPSKSGYIQLSLHVCRVAAAVFFFTSHSSIAMSMIGGKIARESKTNGILNEISRTHTRRPNEDTKYKVFILSTCEWFMNCECRNRLVC